jgi:hypothetical protein
MGKFGGVVRCSAPQYWFIIYKVVKKYFGALHLCCLRHNLKTTKVLVRCTCLPLKVFVQFLFLEKNETGCANSLH